MELPLSRNWVERAWKPRFSSGMRRGGSGPRAYAGRAVRTRSQPSAAQRRRCGVGMGTFGTGMAFDAYPYTQSIARRGNVSQTHEQRQRVQIVTSAVAARTGAVIQRLGNFDSRKGRRDVEWM